MDEEANTTRDRSMTHVDTSAPILVTGATGYVAGWIVKELLEAGATVHAPVRAPDDLDKVGHLRALADASPGAIRLSRADLLEEGSYAEAMRGCSVVLHTASPFTSDFDDPQAELVDPALLGTRNVLAEAGRTPTVRRVVLTSSCAAMYGDNADIANAPGGVLTEEVWNTTSSLEHNPYSWSKTMAEREAWRIAEDQDRWDLVVVNPCLVVGPALDPRPTSESFSLVKRIGDGSMRMGAPRWGVGVVDVREVARAHVEAAFRPEAAGRHIVCGHETDFLEMGRALGDRYGDDYPLPDRALPKWLVRLVGPWLDDSLTRRAVARNVDVPWRADNAKSVRALGLRYRPMRESLEEMFQQMIDRGYFETG